MSTFTTAYEATLHRYPAHRHTAEPGKRMPQQFIIPPYPHVLQFRLLRSSDTGSRVPVTLITHPPIQNPRLSARSPSAAALNFYNCTALAERGTGTDAVCFLKQAPRKAPPTTYGSSSLVWLTARLGEMMRRRQRKACPRYYQNPSPSTPPPTRLQLTYG